MSRHDVLRDGARLSGTDAGGGRAVVFQHGLGGDDAQVAEVFAENDFRRLTLECRAHGKSEPGDSAAFSIHTFADDVLAFAQSRGVGRFVMGGISMGAAIALRIAIKHPDKVTALILARPAWLWDKAPENMHVLAELSHYIGDKRRDEFEASPTAKMLAKEAPDNLASMRNFFDRPDPITSARLLAAIAADGPGVTETDVRGITIPTLIIANSKDWVHPVSHARTLARMIPNAKLVEIVPKADDKPRHLGEFRAAVFAFLQNEGREK